MATIDRIDLIRNKINLLHQQDKNLQTFGANYHKYLLKPTVTIQELTAFEEKYGIVLPEGYRQFLLLIGNGGAGPYYGLFPMQNWQGEREHLQIDFLSRSFPHRETWRPDSELTDQQAIDDEHAYFGNYWSQGAVTICHFGCGVYFLLVVSGPKHGTIWMDDRVTDWGITPCNCDFLAWYETWLDDSLQKLTSSEKPYI